MTRWAAKLLSLVGLALVTLAVWAALIWTGHGAEAQSAALPLVTLAVGGLLTYIHPGASDPETVDSTATSRSSTASEVPVVRVQ